jgi:AsmA family protein
MRALRVVRRIAALTMVVGTVLLMITAGLVAAVDAGYGRSLLIHYFASRLGRPIQVNGTVQARIFSHHPRVVAEHVTIGNPPWMPAGTAAEVGKVTVILALPEFAHPSDIVELDMDAATFHLVRDAAGYANWQLNDPREPKAHQYSSIVRSLSIPNARVMLEDAVRHLQFAGTVSAHDPSASGNGTPLQIEGAGQLNGRATAFKITADPLDTASHDSPYHFAFAERSSASRLDIRGFLPRPFDVDVADTTFEATGSDLKDLYYLTGVALLDTGSYHLSGKALRRGTLTQFIDLVATSGQSDVHGRVSIDSSGARRKLDLVLDSQLLHLSDLGLRAAGRTSEPESSLLLSEATLSSQVLRAADATVNYRAHRVDMGRLPLLDVSVKANIDHGVLKVAPFSAKVFGSTVNGRLTLDARKKIPAADVNLNVTDLQLADFPYKAAGSPPVEGMMQARVTVSGTGSSVHAVAASATGTVTAQLPQGAIRASIAEFAGGIDLRGLGLLLTHNKSEVPVHCAIATFKADAGTLVAQDVVVDTEPMLITGEGQIHLDSEALNLVIHGYPKKSRLFRLRGPVLVRGTLAHPSITPQRGNSIPLIVDPGRANNADCNELLSLANSAGAPPG